MTIFSCSCATSKNSSILHKYPHALSLGIGQMTDAKISRLKIEWLIDQSCRRNFMFRFGDKMTIVSLVFLFGLAGPLSALPKYERTTLPLPPMMDRSDQYMAKEVLQLEVYRDSDDPNQFYYVPPFHIRQYERGAASMVLHAHNVKQFSAALKSLLERDEFGEQKISDRKRELRDAESKKADIELTLYDAISQNNERLTALLEKRMAQQQLNIDEIKREIKALAATLLKKSDQQTSLHLGQAGFNVDVNKVDNSEERFDLLKNA